jgi:flagellar motility protein MotE (MotC chaperone)
MFPSWSIGPAIAKEEIVMRLKDIIALGLLSLLSFPLVLLGVLLGLGKIHMSFGSDPLSPEAKARLAEHAEMGSAVPGHDSGAVGKGSVSDEREAEIDRREATALEEQKRLEALREDVVHVRDSIAKERDALEKLLGKGDSLSALRMKALATTLSSMKPDDAAKVLVGLDDIMAVGVLRTISEDRPRAKILASVSRLSDVRASQFAKLLGSMPSKASQEKKAAPAKEETSAKEGEASKAKEASTSKPEKAK